MAFSTFRMRKAGVQDTGNDTALPSTLDATSTSSQASATPTAAYTAPGLTDPVAANQWHLGKIGNVARVWDDFTGDGVSVGVFDSGVDYRVAELGVNYDASKEFVLDGRRYDGGFRPAVGLQAAHGTAVAGLIAAARDGVGTVGIAYDASLTGVNIFDPWSGGGRDPGIFINNPDQTKFLTAMRHAKNFDVVNHSWGTSTPTHDAAANRAVAGSRAAKVVATVTEAAEEGRDGLGTVSLKAAGNYGLLEYRVWPFQGSADGQGDSVSTDRHWLQVAAYRGVDGMASSYSTRGSHLLISAPSDDYVALGGTGIWSTDAFGRDGYNTTDDPSGMKDYTNTFGGTSAATPIVSGVVSLMLDANAGLGWRDVKDILAASAKLPVAFETGPTISVEMNGRRFYLNDDQFKVTGTGASSSVNGGGYHYSTDYGYGAVDAYAAARMAEVWSLFGEAKTSANEESVVVSQQVDTRLPVATGPWPTHTYSPVTFTVNVEGNINVEHLDLYYTYSTPEQNLNYSKAYQIRVTSPDGVSFDTNMNILPANYGPVANGPITQVLGLAGFRGETSAGEWKVTIFDIATNNSSVVNSLRLQFYGSEASSDDVHSYTDEFFTMAAVAGQDARRTLSDLDGGDDWINAAAVSSDITLSLTEGATTRFGNADAFTIARGSAIEHAVTGDGNDRLLGNALDNKLYGMRGDDWLNGGAGNDTLFGGTGNDVFAFDTAGISGSDRVLDWSAGDRIATSKMLRGADQNGLLTVGSNALVLLDNMARGDTAELVGQGGAVLKALGKTDGYWWYGFVSGGDEDFVDGRVTELALGQTGRTPGASSEAATGHADLLAATEDQGLAVQDTAFFLYDTMGDAMASGVQTWA